MTTRGGHQWASGGRNTNCSSPNPATGKVDPDCVPLQPEAWDSAVRPLISRVENSSATPFFSASPLAAFFINTAHNAVG